MILFILDQLGTFSEIWSIMSLFLVAVHTLVSFLSLDHLFITLHLQFLFPRSYLLATKIWAIRTIYCLNILLLHSGLMMHHPEYFITKFMFNSFFNKQVIFTYKRATVYSSLGIKIHFFGTTLDFPNNKLQWTQSSLSKRLI